MDVDPGVGTEAQYRAAVGTKADFYAPKFMRFDQPGASKISWNWPACFVSFFWFLYRRMYGYWAIYCLLIPIILGIVGGIAIAILGSRLGNSLYCVATLCFTYVVIPMYANSLYHRSIKARIQELRKKVSDPAIQLAVLENGPHTSHIVWVVIPFVMIAVVGILAAIAIPAYQDYTIRAQITEGLNLSSPLKAEIAEKYVANSSWPLNITELGVPQSLSGNYVASIAVDRGTITITYGNRANNLVAEHVLSLRPAVGDGGAVVWSCGYGTPTGDDPPTGPSGENRTDIAAKFLPSACRGNRR
jgi:type IV pilus assembly protein PilA